MEEQNKPLGAPQIQSDHTTDPLQPTQPQKQKRKLNWKGFAIGIVAVIIIEFFAISMLNSPDPEIPIQPPTNATPTSAQATPNAQTTEILTVTTRGGFCPTDDPCSTGTIVLSDGSVRQKDKELKKLSQAQVQQLQKHIKDTDFEAIKQTKFSGTCPTAYDGQETVYTVYRDSVKEELPSCTYDLDLKLPLFSFIEANIQ